MKKKSAAPLEAARRDDELPDSEFDNHDTKIASDKATAMQRVRR